MNNSPNIRAIERYLDGVRRRCMAAQVLGQTTLYAAATAAGILVLLLISPWLHYFHVVRVLAAAIVATTATALLVHLMAAARKLADRRQAAKIVGKRYPALHSDLLSTVELAREPAPRFSTALLGALARDTWQQLRSIPPKTVTPTRVLRVAGLALCIAMGAWGVAAVLSLDRLQEAGAALIGWQRGPLEVAPQRLVRDINISYTFPAYMRRAKQTMESATGHVAAPLGTRIDFSAHPIEAVEEAELVITELGNEGSRQVRLRTDHGSLSGAFKIEGAGHYYLQVGRPGGRLVRDPIDLRIQVEPDTKPKVALLGPPDRLDVGARQQIELAYTAEDDWGLSRVDLVFRHDSSNPGRVTLWTPSGKSTQADRPPTQSAKPHQLPRHAIGKYTWDLDPLDLHRGGTVVYWIEAADNDTVSGPKVTRSKVLSLVVFSPEQRHDRTLAQQRQALEGALRLLSGYLLAKDLVKTNGQPAQTKTVESQFERQAALADNIRQLQRLMREDRLVPQATLSTVTQVYRRLNDLVRDGSGLRAQLRRAHGYLRPRLRRRLQRHNTRSTAELEQDVLLLNGLIDEQQLQSVVAMVDRLRQTRKRLGELLKRYQQNKDPQLRRQLLQEIERMQRQLGRLAQHLAQLGSTISDEYLNADAVEKLNVSQGLEHLRSLLDKGNAKDISAALASLDEKLAQMNDLMRSNLSSFRSERLSNREKAFNAMVDRLQGLERDQQRLAQQTAKVVERYRKRSSELLKNELDDLLQQQRLAQERLRREVRDLQRRRLEPHQRQAVEQIARWTDWLGEGLRKRDFDRTLRMANKVDQGLEQFIDDLREDVLDAYPPWRQRHLQALKRARKAQATASEIAQRLTASLPKPSSLLSPGDRQQLKQTRRGQRALQRRLAQMSEPNNKQAHGLSALLGKKQRAILKDAKGLMQDARNKLARIEPQQAHAAQQAAAKRLSRARQALRQARQARQPGSRVSYRDRVRIPEADAFQAPEAFRKALLDAMRHPAPKGFERPVGNYYKELVR